MIPTVTVARSWHTGFIGRACTVCHLCSVSNGEFRNILERFKELEVDFVVSFGVNQHSNFQV